jgi:hypothetical protein
MDRWAGTIDARPLGLARIMIGSATLLKLAVVAPLVLALAAPDTERLPWLDGFAPTFAAPLGVIGVWAAAACAFTIGWRTRVAGTVLTAAMVATLLSDRQLYSNHLYLLILLVALLVFADAGATLSLDARRQTLSRRVSIIGADLLRIQLSIVYFFAAIWKINEQFLSGWIPGSYLQNGFLTIPGSMRTPEILAWLAGMTILVELMLAFALWSPRFRAPAAATGVLLHVMFVLLIEEWAELIVFGAAMLAIYPLFFVGGTPAARPHAARPGQ